MIFGEHITFVFGCGRFSLDSKNHFPDSQRDYPNPYIIFPYSPPYIYMYFFFIEFYVIVVPGETLKLLSDLLCPRCHLVFIVLGIMNYYNHCDCPPVIGSFGGNGVLVNRFFVIYFKGTLKEVS